jgi:hypothetical protein
VIPSARETVRPQKKKLGEAFVALPPSFGSSPNDLFRRENAYFFLATAFLAGAFLATAFFAGAFFATTFLAGAFLATAFLAGAFLATAFFAGAFFATTFLAGAFLATAFLGGCFFCSFFNGHFNPPPFFRMGGDCENLVNNSLVIVNKSLTVMRQRIFKTFFSMLNNFSGSHH